MSAPVNLHREGSLEAPTRHPLHWKNPQFHDEAATLAEMQRVFDICHGCRRCVSLCNAFPTLFDLVDNSTTQELDGVAKRDYWQVADHCYLCDLCYMTKCPYVPPHPWALDFPHLMLRAKAVRYRQGEVRLRDRVLTSTRTVGALAGIPVVAEAVNRVNTLQPLRKAGVPVHMAMGNHDQRANFWKAFSPAEGAKMLVDQRQVSIVPSPRANWFVLDSLDVTNKTPGVCGEKQLAWLSQALDQHAEKPAIVMVHHNPDEREQPSGLVDTAALYAALESRKHVKALFFGHTHNWSVTERKGLHLINLPPTAYVFGEGKPNGWVDVQLLEGGMKLQLHCLDANHALHKKTHDLRWT